MPLCDSGPVLFDRAFDVFKQIYTRFKTITETGFVYLTQPLDAFYYRHDSALVTYPCGPSHVRMDVWMGFGLQT
ncbi:hypothetical protein Q4602_04020 [Paraglaciecola chathamensis]|uniref:hypothetical protein n=1 Tax=Paraglaciecola chathamensis TaxID=368405 RepID=UPI0027057C42|nr:hypothetical protein [Paraglaciecola chathamensis]MDO6838623.1 hypothetical protein [Paraglaciecola chathamensis]